MPYAWPEDTDFALWELDVLDRDCPACGRLMYVCDHRHRRIHTLEGPVQLICKLNHCPDPRCPGHARTKSPGYHGFRGDRQMSMTSGRKATMLRATELFLVSPQQGRRHACDRPPARTHPGAEDDLYPLLSTAV